MSQSNRDERIDQLLSVCIREHSASMRRRTVSNNNSGFFILDAAEIAHKMSPRIIPGRLQSKRKRRKTGSADCARLLKNRRAAQISREKKKMYIKGLEEQVRSLQTENTELRSAVAQLKEELSAVKKTPLITDSPMMLCETTNSSNSNIKLGPLVQPLFLSPDDSNTNPSSLTLEASNVKPHNQNEKSQLPRTLINSDSRLCETSEKPPQSTIVLTTATTLGFPSQSFSDSSLSPQNQTNAVGGHISMLQPDPSLPDALLPAPLSMLPPNGSTSSQNPTSSLINNRPDVSTSESMQTNVVVPEVPTVVNRSPMTRSKTRLQKLLDNKMQPPDGISMPHSTDGINLLALVSQSEVPDNAENKVEEAPQVPFVSVPTNFDAITENQTTMLQTSTVLDTLNTAKKIDSCQAARTPSFPSCQTPNDTMMTIE